MKVSYKFIAVNRQTSRIKMKKTLLSILSIASLISLERLPLFDPIEKYTLLISFINERQKNIFS